MELLLTEIAISIFECIQKICGFVHLKGPSEHHYSPPA